MSIDRTGSTPFGATGGALAGYPQVRRTRRVLATDDAITRTIQSTDGTMIVDMLGGAAEIILPDLLCVPENLPIFVVKIDSGGALTLTPQAGQLVNEAASFAIADPVLSGRLVAVKSSGGVRSWYVA